MGIEITKNPEIIKDVLHGKVFNQEEIIEFLSTLELTEIKIGNDEAEWRKFYAKEFMEVEGVEQKYWDRTIYFQLDDNNKIVNSEYLPFTVKNRKKLKNLSTLGVTIISGIIVFIILIVYLITTIDFESDDNDCNDSYIEYDYNGDGEKDAEDYRIQTSEC